MDVSRIISFIEKENFETILKFFDEFHLCNLLNRNYVELILKQYESKIEICKKVYHELRNMLFDQELSTDERDFILSLLSKMELAHELYLEYKECIRKNNAA